MMNSSQVSSPHSFFTRFPCKRKVYISQYLDSHPGASVLLLRAKLFLRDNFNVDLLTPHGTTGQQNQNRD
jgi:hypothetical protein